MKSLEDHAGSSPHASCIMGGLAHVAQERSSKSSTISWAGRCHDHAYAWSFCRASRLAVITHDAGYNLPASLPSFTILILYSNKSTWYLVQSLGTLIGYTPLHQSFRDHYCTVECLLVILCHDNATVERSTTLRRRIHPRESVSTLPKYADVSAIDIARRHVLFGQFAQDAFQFLD
jgi:hypothetical protein